MPETVVGLREDWRPGSVIRPGDNGSLELDLGRGAWNLSLQYFTPYGLTLKGPGLSKRLEPTLDSLRLANQESGAFGPFWDAGRIEVADRREDPNGRSDLEVGGGRGIGSDQAALCKTFDLGDHRRQAREVGGDPLGRYSMPLPGRANELHGEVRSGRIERFATPEGPHGLRPEVECRPGQCCSSCMKQVG